MHLIYLIHKFHNLSLITEINELFHDILIYWDAPVYYRDYVLVKQVHLQLMCISTLFSPQFPVTSPVFCPLTENKNE